MKFYYVQTLPHTSIIGLKTYTRHLTRDTMVHSCKEFWIPLIGKTTKSVITFLALSLLLSTVNWMCIHFIATYCAPWEWHGPFINMLNMGSPACILVNNIQVTVANYYVLIWGSMTTALVVWIGITMTPHVTKKI